MNDLLNEKTNMIIDATPERNEAEMEHLRTEHDYFISANVPIEVVRMLHNQDHKKTKKTIYYIPHEH